MRIAVASGKGGTGKTTVATNLAWTARREGRTVAYLDCDVEEPNGHLFLKPEIASRKPVEVLVPSVDADECTLCGECGRICCFSAILRMPSAVLVFPELCTSCGGCALVCEAGAITEVPRETGLLETGEAGGVQFVQGTLRIGEARSVAVIEAVKNAAPDVEVVIVDASPGTSCPVIEAVRGADLVLLVTEPTPFGLHDLKLAVEMVRAVGLGFGVVINRADLTFREVDRYCRAEQIDVLATIPDDRRIAESYSRGILACEALTEYRAVFSDLLRGLLAAAGVEA